LRADGQQPDGAAIEDDSFQTFFTETGASPLRLLARQRARGTERGSEPRDVYPTLHARH